MKDSIRAAGFITLFALMMPLGSPRAEEKSMKEQRAEVQQMLGCLWFSALPYLSDDEKKVISDVLQKGLEREYLKKTRQEEVGEPSFSKK